MPEKRSRIRQGFLWLLLGLGTWKSAPGEVGAELDQHLRLVDGSFWLLEGSPWSLQTLWDET